MEVMITRMLEMFEEGRLSRRDLVKSLSLAVTAMAAGRSTAAASSVEGGFKATSLDHISYQVGDYRKTRDFYADLLGMNVRLDNGTNQAVLEFGDSLLIARNHRARDGQADEGPRVDHIAYHIEDWDSATVNAELERRGLEARLDKGGDIPHYVSYHVEDPDGFDVQISGIAKPGDAEYEERG